MNKKFVSAMILGLTVGTAWTAGHSEEVKSGDQKTSMDQAVKPADSDVQQFTQVAIEYKGTKIWLPGTIIVKKGQKVKIKLINNIESEPNVHGFAIDEYGVKTSVARGEPQTVEFTADKEGIFRIYCHLHPAHVGGQLLRSAEHT